MQKAIRRGDARLGGYWAVELHESGFGDYVWRRLMTIDEHRALNPCQPGLFDDLVD